MRVSEIFYSIQGEGVNIGKPAVFIRLAHCNLKCSWCDTTYTWNFGNGEKNQYEKTFNIHQETRDINNVALFYFPDKLEYKEQNVQLLRTILELFSSCSHARY